MRAQESGCAAGGTTENRGLILKSDRKVGKDFRDRIVSGEAKPAEHNGDIWSRASTKHGAILAGMNPRFLLDISIIRSCNKKA